MGCGHPSLLRCTLRYHQHYTLGNKIGEGSFGQVRVAVSENSHEPRAVKVIPLNCGGGRCIDERKLEVARQEERLWRLVGRHEHCVELLSACITDGLYFMVMEMCEASLMDRLGELARMGESCLVGIFRQMALGVAHIHRQRLVHRDLKPHNFLFGGVDGETVKVCDFGLSALLPKSGGFLTGTYGTGPYMSPEMVGNRGHGQSTDVWSLGATAYLVLYGDFAYSPAEATCGAMKLAILVGAPAPKYVSAVREIPQPSEEAAQFVQRMLEREPVDRCTAEEALLDPFMKTDTLSTMEEEGEAVGKKLSVTSTLRRVGKRIREFESATKGEAQKNSMTVMVPSWAVDLLSTTTRTSR